MEFISAIVLSYLVIKNAGMKICYSSQIGEEVYKEMKPDDAESHYVLYATAPRRGVVQSSSNSRRKLMPIQEL